MNMKFFVLLLASATFFSVTYAKLNYFSDIFENEYKKLQETANYLRKRIDDTGSSEAVGNKKFFNELFLNTIKPNYEFSLKKAMSAKDDSSSFGFGPSDPRFYEDVKNKKKEFKENIAPLLEENNQQKLNEINSFNNEALKFKNRIITNTDVQQIPVNSSYDKINKADIYFIGIVAGCSAAAIFVTLVIGVSCYRLRKNAKATADVDYPAYGITGPNRGISPLWSDQKLAQSIQMYHYQHQKQQIIAMESINNKEQEFSDMESEENDEGDYTVYECPGLASTKEMEVKNPMFLNDQASKQIK